MLVNKQEMEKIIFQDEGKLVTIFSRRNYALMHNFLLLIEILIEKEEKIPWSVYTTFKNSQSLLTGEEISRNHEKIKKIHKTFGDLSLEEIELNIFKALDENNVENLIKSEDDIENYLFGLDVFPNKLIEMLKELLDNSTFLYANGSWHILAVLHYECEKVSSQQWIALLPHIEKSYSKFKDWMSCFIITEIIGNDFPTTESFAMLVKLRNIEDEVCRSYIPNALEGFVKNSLDPKIRKEAYNNIVDMLNDMSTIVTKESLRSYESVKDIAIYL